MILKHDANQKENQAVQLMKGCGFKSRKLSCYVFWKNTELRSRKRCLIGCHTFVWWPATSAFGDLLGLSMTHCFSFPSVQQRGSEAGQREDNEGPADDGALRPQPLWPYTDVEAVALHTALVYYLQYMEL